MSKSEQHYGEGRGVYRGDREVEIGDLSQPLIQNPTPGAGYGGSNSSETRYVGVLVIPSDTGVDTVANEYGVNPKYVRRKSEFETHHSNINNQVGRNSEYALRTVKL